MNNVKSSRNPQYSKIIIDNAVCERRFHLSFEKYGTPKENVSVSCPHCHLIIYEQKNHSEILLVREENLVKSPTEKDNIIYECQFNFL